MKVLLTVSVCCFVLYTVPLPSNALVDKERLFDTLKPAISGIKYKNGSNHDLLTPGVSFTEALLLHDTIAKIYPNIAKKSRTLDFTKRIFNKSLPTWVVSALNGGGNSVNGVLCGILNRLLGGQTLIVVGRPQTEAELAIEKQALGDQNRFQRKLDITKIFNELLVSAKALGIPVIEQDKTRNDLGCLLEAYNVEYSDLEVEVVLDSLLGKGFIVTTQFLDNAKPSLYFVKAQSEKGKCIWGVDGASGANIFGLTVADGITQESLDLLTKSTYTTLLYGLSGKEKEFMKTYSSDRLFVVSNDTVEDAVKSILATSGTSAIQYALVVVTYEDILNNLQDTFYSNLSELQAMLNLKITWS